MMFDSSLLSSSRPVQCRAASASPPPHRQPRSPPFCVPPYPCGRGPLRSHTDLLAESDEGKEDIAKDIGNCGEMLSQLGERPHAQTNEPLGREGDT